MSLLLLSNDTSLNENGGISQSNSWTNVTQTPLVIKKNSEIALQSLKVNKEGQVEVSSSNNRFGFYFGNYIDENVANDYLNQIRNVNTVTIEPNKTYDTDELINVIKEKVPKSIFHPDFQDGFNASVNYVSGDFSGYNLRMNYTSSAPSSALPTQFITAEAGGGGFTYNASTGTLTASPTAACSAIGTTAPLSANSGRFIATFNTAGVDWKIGLSRYATETRDQPPYANVESDLGWFDFVALRDDQSKLRLYHAVHDDDFDDKGEISLNEVVYYGYTGAEYTTPYDLNTNASAFDEVEFQLKGDKMELYLSKTGSLRTLVCSPDLGTPGKTNYFKPVNQVCSYLYPKIELSQTLVSQVKTYEGRVPTNFDYEGGSNSNPLSMDFYRTCLQTGKISLCQDLDTRFYNDINDATEYTFLGTNASGAIDFSCVLVVGNSFTYKVPEVPVNGFNVQELLGFEGENYVKATTIDNVFEKFTSTDTPKYLSTDSIFVRLTSLTQNSKNGFTGNDSKIIYHCPRFDNSGQEQGALYFEPGEKTYIDISNAADMNVNSFSVDLVDRNERPVSGLIGGTIVMIHIREKKQ